MTNHFFPGMQEVGERVHQAPRVFLALDYDGTLTPIVDDPADALLAAPMRQLLGELARRRDVDMAIVSGRALADLQDVAGISGPIYAGNHGMEINGRGISFVEPVAHASAQALHEIRRDLTEKLRHIPGALIEDKGLTLSIHHRRVAPIDAAEVWQTVLRAVEPLSDRFHVTPGAKVYEVRPLVRWDKGAAVKWIKERLGLRDALVMYIGDDATDEDAFVALDGSAVTIKIGDSAATTAARYLLPSPAEVYGFLQWIHELLQEKSSPKQDDR